MEVLVVCGPSGSGKSTLIRCINRLETIDSGDLVVDGIAVHERRPDLPSLLLDEEFAAWIDERQTNWRRTVAAAQGIGVPIPTMSASLAYFDSYRTERLPQNLTQAQRDAFGAHTYERLDQLERGFIHTEWL